MVLSILYDAQLSASCNSALCTQALLVFTRYIPSRQESPNEAQKPDVPKIEER